MNPAVITWKIKTMFFDRPEIMRAVEKGRREALGHAANAIKLTAKWSMRKRKGPSKPGHPPHAHIGWLRKYLLAGYDVTTQSAVAGPVALKSKVIVPPLMEFGGKQRLTFRRKDKRTGAIRKRRVTAKYSERPYMGSALDKNRDKIPLMWQGAVHG